MSAQISTRVKVRPGLEKALALARQFKEAASETPVIFTVHELKCLARNAAELMTLSAGLQADGIQPDIFNRSGKRVTAMPEQLDKDLVVGDS